MSARGLWYEDFEIGRERVSPSRTVAESDIFAFGGLTGDLYELHTSEAYARNTPFGGRIAHGMFSLSLMHGLVCRTAHVEGTGVAMLGWDNIRFLRPLRIGDTVHTRFAPIRKRPSAGRPGAGVVVELLRLVNQNGETVTSGEYTSMVRMKSA